MTCYNSELPIGPPGPTGPQGPAGPPGSGGVSLAETLLIGNDTNGTDINLTLGDAIILGNNSKIEEGTVDNGFGGGVSLICSNEKEQQWENGVRYLRQVGNTIVYAETLDDIDPSNFYDNTKNWAVGSRYKNLVTGIEYICTDATTDIAVWIAQSGEYQPTVIYSANINNGFGTAVNAIYSVNGKIMTLGIYFQQITIDFNANTDASIMIELPTGFQPTSEVGGSVSVKFNTAPTAAATPIFTNGSYGGAGRIGIYLQNYGGVANDIYDITATFVLNLQ